MQINIASANAIAALYGTDFAAGTLVVYSGTIPASADAALGGAVALATHNMAGWTAGGTGVITADAIANAVIAATGTAAFARIVDGTKTMQLTVGTSGTELILSSLSYVSGEDSIVNSLTLTQPQS